MGGGASTIKGDHKRLVVVGGGYGGWSVALRTAGVKNLTVTVIDSREYVLHNLAAPRAAVRPGWAEAPLVSRVTPEGAEFVQGWVTGITDTEVTATLSRTGEAATFAYDYLVLATGSSVRFPGKLSRAQGDAAEDARGAFTRLATAVKAAKRITIVGGGPVGLETAGEIVSMYNDKEVNVIHSGPHLLSGNGYKVANCEAVHQRATKIGINVVLNERVNMPTELRPAGAGAAGGAGETAAGGEETKVAGDDYLSGTRTITTESGQSYETDLLLWCTGATTNSSAYSGWLGDAVASNGRINVNEHMQVADKPTVFALGDCADTVEPKLAVVANKHAEVVAANIVKHANGKKLSSHKPMPPIMFLTLGNRSGGGQLPNGASAPAGLVKFAKGRDMMVKKFHKDMGSKAPVMPKMSKPVSSA